MTGAAIETGTTLRLCETEGCETRLSRFNSRRICASCEARIEIGGATIPLPKQPAFPARPPAPERPTTDGGITLPGVVPGRERSYEEMIAKPATADLGKPMSTCAECGKAIPSARHGWLCDTCLPAAGVEQKRAEIADKTPEKASLETSQTRIPARAHDDSKADSKAPAKSSRKRTEPQDDPVRSGPHNGNPTPAKRRGSARKFDWAHAADLYREHRNFTTVARLLGVAQQSVGAAVKHELGPEVMATMPPRPGRRTIDRSLCRRRDCTDPARPGSVDLDDGNRFARLCEHHHRAELDKQNADRKVERELLIRARQTAPIVAPERRAELARLAAELDEIHNEQTRLYARWRVTAERHAELLREAA